MTQEEQRQIIARSDITDIFIKKIADHWEVRVRRADNIYTLHEGTKQECLAIVGSCT